MTSAISSLTRPLRRKLTHRQSIALVFVCTLIGAAAQVLMKIGAHNLPTTPALAANPLILFKDIALFGGLSCYGLFTLLLIFALRDGELSIIYPVIALNYVWVTILSLIFFQETMNPFKAAGILVIMLGVGIPGQERLTLKTPLSSMLLVLVAAFIGSFGAVFLKMGSAQLRDGLRQILNYRLGVGVAMYLISSVFFIIAIRHGELTVLYPLVSLGYVFTMLWSRLFFKEPFTRDKFVGLALILVGVSFIGIGNR